MRQAAINRRSVHRKMVTFDTARSKATSAQQSSLLLVVLAESVQRGDALAVVLEDGQLVARKARPIKEHYFATIGLASGQGAAGDSVGVQTSGTFNSSRYDLIAGQPLFINAVSAYGMDSAVVPSDCLYEVGLAVNETTILVRAGLRVVRG